MDFRQLTRQERRDALAALGEKPFREKQIFRWICRGAESFSEMTDLSAALRVKLSSSYSFGKSRVIQTQRSSDGTVKYLLAFPDGEKAEAVFMKYSYGNSLCVSTQVGCNMRCAFCASGLGGKRRDLLAWEILDEYIVCSKAAGEPINHVVLMGMGEPFDNYENVAGSLRLIHDPDGINLSYRSITVSTCGLVPFMKRFGDEFPQVNLAVSLHASSQKARMELMPAAKAYPLDVLLPACRDHAEKTGRRITFEYALISGKNDSAEDVRSLSALLRGINCHVNLIPLNPVKESGLDTVSRQAAHAFAEKLESLGIPCTVRRQLGADIDAACGQLRKKHEESFADKNDAGNRGDNKV